MIRVRTGSRLHFGLLAPEPGGDRIFGGVGLMVEQPGVEITLQPAERWTVDGPLAARCEAILQRMLKAVPLPDCSPLKLSVVRSAPEHSGLGTGTQLALAIGSALLQLTARPEPDAAALAALAGRGLRSGIGLHGFHVGGFLVDGGKREPSRIAPLVARQAFPENWRILLVLPQDVAAGRHGDAERETFQRMERGACALTDTLCCHVLLGMLPALVERDLSSFSEHLHQFNRLAGEPFRNTQGATYAHPRIATLVDAIRQLGVAGAGQSSWGPAVFAITEDEDRARWVARHLSRSHALSESELIVTPAANHGREITVT